MGALPLAAPEAAFDLKESDFRLIAEIVHGKAGIVVRAHKQAMVRGRLMRRVRELGLPSIDAYCALLRGPGLDDELPGLLNALTTNHTAFFREAHHFDHLAQTALPWAMPQGGAAGRRVRLWCSAASTGEEPYTIAGVVNAYVKGRDVGDLRILATDIDSDVLARAEAGLYPAAAVAALRPDQQALLKAESAGGGQAEMPAALKRLLTFRQLNIIESWPFAGPFQMIFCRNMLIYFDQPTKTNVIDRFAQMLVPGGYLYLGHSEALTQNHPLLEPCGRTIYRRR
jgi:chemotaxis protein methyltransferase CheR